MPDLIEPGLALTEAPSCAADLAAMPLDAVLNVCDEGTPAYCPSQTHQIIQAAFPDSVPAPFSLLAVAVLELAELRRQGKAVLVHCQAGQSRSPTVIALYWMARDGLTWPEALSRLRSKRPRVQPHPLLTDEATRSRMVAAVRAFLAGDQTVLAAARAEAERLWEADRVRGAEPSPRAFDWNLIETGLAIGDYPRPVEEVVRHGFGCLLNLETTGPRVPYAGVLPAGMACLCMEFADENPDPGRVKQAVWQLRDWRSQGKAVFLHCPGGRFRSALVAALYLTAARGWDFTTVLWYIRRRRPAAWAHPQVGSAFCGEP